MRTRNRQGSSHRDGKRNGLKVSGSVEDGGLLEYFFGKDGNERLGHDKFVKFLRDLHDEVYYAFLIHVQYCRSFLFASYKVLFSFISFFSFVKNRQMLRLEFAHYDHNSEGTISAKDFILSMIASADMRYINKFLDQVDELQNEPSLRDLRVTFGEFKNFAELRKRLEPFSMALFSYGKVNGLLSKQDFKRAAHQVCVCVCVCL